MEVDGVFSGDHVGDGGAGGGGLFRGLGLGFRSRHRGYDSLKISAMIDRQGCLRNWQDTYVPRCRTSSWTGKQENYERVRKVLWCLIVVFA